jgi:hypothetical protein
MPMVSLGQCPHSKCSVSPNSIPSTLCSIPVQQLHELGFREMKQLLPALFEKNCPTSPIVGAPVLAADIDSLQHETLMRQRTVIEYELFNMSTSMKHMVATSNEFQIHVLSKSVKLALENYLWTNKLNDFKLAVSDNICAFSKGISSCPIVASDGSFKDSLASFAVKTEVHAFSSTLPGMQTIQRAELFGILAAIWVTNVNTPVTIVTDSYSSKSVFDSLWSQRLMPRKFACPANRSFLMSIIHLLEERELAGSSTSISWIPSHTSGNDDTVEYLLNAAADRLATKA